MKFHAITKFGMINLVVRLILCLNEKQSEKLDISKKVQFAVLTTEY